MVCHNLLLDRGEVFFFIATAPTEIYTLSLHDALPILSRESRGGRQDQRSRLRMDRKTGEATLKRPLTGGGRSEEHTSELQSRFDLVCRLLLEKKKQHTRHTVLG